MDVKFNSQDYDNDESNKKINNIIQLKNFLC